jgi:hypothetical protein
VLLQPDCTLGRLNSSTRTDEAVSFDSDIAPSRKFPKKFVPLTSWSRPELPRRRPEPLHQELEQHRPPELHHWPAELRSRPGLHCPPALHHWPAEPSHPLEPPRHQPEEEEEEDWPPRPWLLARPLR